MKFSTHLKNYLLFSLLLLFCLLDTYKLNAQDIQACAQTVATCYAQDANGEVGVIYDTRFNAFAPIGNDWVTVPAIHPVQWTRGRIGNVFGIALDNQSGDIYLAATDVYKYDGLFAPFGLSASASGPGGTAGVYKTNINITNVTTPIVFTTNLAGLPVYNTGNLVPNTGGDGNGIGNIVCNQNNGDLFFTNLEDGRIYRTDANGNLLGAFDPFNDDSNSAGFQEFPEERIWGIGIYTDISNTTRVYFAREEGTINTKQIWSIALDASGQFTGTAANGEYIDAEMLELDNIPGTQKKITDIAFAADGKMLLAERGGPHSSSIFEYKTPSGWVSSGVPYFVGQGAGKNSAGGVDYGYKEDNKNPTALCDALIWATGNCMEVAGIGGGISCDVYGIEGIANTGNAASPSNGATDLFIDFDQLYVFQQKLQIGDVEQFKCGCPPDNAVCEAISVNSKSSQGEGDSCCFVLAVDNQQSNFFSGIQLCSSNGVSISAVGSLNGWTIGGYSSQFISLVPPSTSVPVGNMDFIKFCLSNYLNVPNQQVLVKYYGPDETLVCVDTLNYECSQKPKCLKITDDVECAEDGKYLMSFCIMSDALIGFDVNSIQLNPPPGITFSPSTFSVGNLTPGQMQCGFQTLVSGALDGDAICYSITAHKEDIFTEPNINPTECCTDTLMLGCVVMPECICNNVSASIEPVDQMGDTCCWNITLNNGYSNNFFSGVQLDIITPGVVFGAIVNPFGSGWSSQSTSNQVVFKPKPLGTFIGASSMLPTFCLSGIDSTSQVPQVVVLSWLDPDGKTVCQDTLYFDCPPPVNTPCAELVNWKIDCDLENPGIYTFTFQVKNNSAFTANQIMLNNINPPFSIIPDVFSIPALAPTQTSAVLTAMVIGVLPNQNLCFDLTMHDVSGGSELNCCTNSQQYCLPAPDCSNSCKCPSPGPQLIENGNFDAGLTGFTSDYSLNSNCFPGRYNVANSTTVVPMCNNWTCIDHTTGSPTGLFFVCDGSQSPGLAAWRQEVNILPSTSYDFCAFVNNLNEPGFDRDDPIIEIWLVDGLVASYLLDTNTPPESPDIWVKVSASWLSPSILNHPYKLEFRTASNSFEGNNFAIDDISFRQCDYQPGNCCIDIETFCSNIENAVTITTDSESCQAKLKISNVDCDDYLEWIDWDYPSQQINGPYLPNNTISHTYTSSGTYNVCYLALERDAEGFICLEKIICEEIEINCEDCQCGLFDKIKVTNKKTGFSQGLECNSDLITELICPAPGKPYKITGKLSCEPTSCKDTNIHWELKEKDTGNIVASGSQLSSWFSITLDNNVLSGLNGLYDLELSGLCGSDTCKCTLHFNISGCPKTQPCPCDEEFFSRVSAGFSYTYNLSLGTCNVIFTPNSLLECDEVLWTIKGQNISFNATGTTTGNQSFTITIPLNSFGGIYEVRMKVSRPNTACKTTFSQLVILSCLIINEENGNCIDNTIVNPGFNQNSEPGILGFEGYTEGWQRSAGTPELLAIEGCTEPYAIRIKGKCWPSDIDIIYNPVKLMPKTGFKLSACFMANEEDLRPGTELVFRLSDEPQEGLNCGEGCIEVARVPINTATGGEWNTVSSTFFLDGVSGDKLLTLHVENDLAYEDKTANSTILLDNLCFEQNETSTVSTTELEGIGAHDFNIFPNPTTGEFVLEFNGYSPKGSKVKVIDLQGRTIQSTLLASDQKVHNLSISAFPVGIYFIEITEEGMPVWVEKVIKY